MKLLPANGAGAAPSRPGLHSVPAVVREITDQAAMAVGLIENIQRENLSAIEEAQGYRRLLEEFGLTHQEVSEAVGCSRTQVTNLLRAADTSSESTENVGKPADRYGPCPGPAGDSTKRASHQPQSRLKTGVCRYRQTENLVRTLIRSEGKKTRRKPDRANSDIARLENELSSRIGARVDIHHRLQEGQAGDPLSLAG